MKRNSIWLVSAGAALLFIIALTVVPSSGDCKSIATRSLAICREAEQAGLTPESLMQQVKVLGNGGASWGSMSGSSIFISHYGVFDVKTPGCRVRLSFEVKDGRVAGNCVAQESF
jgi:hypothetical protein